MERKRQIGTSVWLPDPNAQSWIVPVAFADVETVLQQRDAALGALKAAVRVIRRLYRRSYQIRSDKRTKAKLWHDGWNNDPELAPIREALGGVDPTEDAFSAHEGKTR